MSTIERDPLEEVIRYSGEGWLIDSFAPGEEALTHLKRSLAVADQRSQERLGANGPRLNEKAIIAEYDRNPHRVKTFIQVLGTTRSPDLLLMVWRIMQGMEIEEVEVVYRRLEDFRMRIALVSPYGEPSEEYQSADINDAALLRHFGILKMNGRPVFDGFYPLRLS
jgi:hypothetical protein